MEGGVVATERTAIHRGKGFVLCAARVRIEDNADGKRIGRVRMDITAVTSKRPRAKRAADAAEVMPVQIDLGLPVNAVEIEP